MMKVTKRDIDSSDPSCLLHDQSVFQHTRSELGCLITRVMRITIDPLQSYHCSVPGLSFET